MREPAGPQPFSLSPLGYRFALVILFGVSFVNYVDRYMLSILLPAIKADLNLSDTEVGLVSGIAFSLFYSAMALPVARIADRYNRRKIIAIAVAAWSLMTALCASSRTFWQLAIFRALVGVGESGATPPSHALIADLFPKARRATAISVYGLGGPVGLVAGFMLGGWLTAHFGWRAALLVVGIPGLFLAAVVYAYLPDPPRGHADGVVGNRAAPPLREALRGLLRNRSFVHNALGSGFAAMLWQGSLAWIPIFFVRQHELGIAHIGFRLAIVLGVAQTFGLIVGGLLADRMTGRDLRWYVWISGGAMVIAIPFYTLAFLWPHPDGAFMLLAIPFCLGTFKVGPQHAVGQLLAGPQRRAVASATLLFVISVVGGLGAPLIGLMSDVLTPHFGPKALGLAIISVTSIASLFAIVHFFRAAITIRQDAKAVDDDMSPPVASLSAAPAQAGL